MSRYQMTPEKTEMVGGRLYGTNEAHEDQGIAERLRRTALSVSTPVTSTSRRWWVRHDSDSILMIQLLQRTWLEEPSSVGRASEGSACPGRLPDILVEKRE